jgi:hypothetical protein
MSTDPLTAQTVSADEKWEDSLDVLAVAVAREMRERGLLRKRAEAEARFHVRSFGRRLINPVLDQVQAEIRAGQQQVVALRRENERLRGRIASLGRARRRSTWVAVLLGSLWTLLVLLLGAGLYMAWGQRPPAPASALAPAPAPPAASAVYLLPRADDGATRVQRFVATG